jgi:hypothetical protein
MITFSQTFYSMCDYGTQTTRAKKGKEKKKKKRKKQICLFFTPFFFELKTESESGKRLNDILSGVSRNEMPFLVFEFVHPKIGKILRPIPTPKKEDLPRFFVYAHLMSASHSR